jgi:FSR family fosmidomycin resistance protein-like MFS transporter
MRRIIPPRLALLALAHFSIDAYSSFFSPLLPLLMTRLHMSLTRVGALVALASVASSFSQPLFGWLSDRVHRPWFVALGPPVAALFLSAIGLAPSFAMLVALLILGGIGVAAFHPQAAAIASGLSTRRSVAMSFFVTGGTLGFSLGPLYAVTVVGRLGLERTWIAAIPGVLMGLLLLSQFARLNPHPRPHGPRPTFAELKPVARPLTLLYFAVVCRSAVSFGFMTFLPIHLHRLGYSVAAGGALLTAYLALGAMGGFFGGWLADRWGGRNVVRASFVGAFPLYVAFLFLPDSLGLPCLILGSFLLQTSLPVNVVLGQELSPRHASTISSLLMGAAWGVGALLIGPIGALADARGLQVALLALTCLLAGGLGCALALPATVGAASPPPEFAQPVFASE